MKRCLSEDTLLQVVFETDENCRQHLASCDACAARYARVMRENARETELIANALCGVADERLKHHRRQAAFPRASAKIAPPDWRILTGGRRWMAAGGVAFAATVIAVALLVGGRSQPAPTQVVASSQASLETSPILVPVDDQSDLLLADPIADIAYDEAAPARSDPYDDILWCMPGAGGIACSSIAD